MCDTLSLHDALPILQARWIIGLINSRIFLELDPRREGAEDWNRLTMEAVLNMIVGGNEDVAREQQAPPS
jgi:hypothetical protein